MYIIDIIPLKYIPRFLPQIYSYFSLQKMNVGSLVRIPIGKQELSGIVASYRIVENKLSIKKAGFETKPIKGIINPEPVITNKQLELAQFLSSYYLLPLSGILESLLPNEKILSKSNLPYFSTSNKKSKSESFYLLGEDFDWLQKKILETTRKNQQVLFLFPNESKLDSYRDKFPDLDILFLGSKGGQKSQIKEREDIYSGKVKIIFGLRRSLSAPFKDLGLVVVIDEENHSPEIKQKIISFNSKIAALKLAEMYGSNLIFQGHTSSIESWHLIDQGVFRLIEATLPSSRPSGTTARRGISFTFREYSKTEKKIIFSESQKAIETSLENKMDSTGSPRGKIFVFINRLGLSPALSCRDCGNTVECSNCDSPVLYYQSKTGFQTRCRHCGVRGSPPSSCSNCGGHLIVSAGLGTQKIFKELRKLFPASNIRIFDSDHIKNIKEEKKILEDLEGGGIDIIVGTEMFLKHFKNSFSDKKVFDLSLIISFGQLINFPDFRNSEKIRNLLITLKTSSQNVLIQDFKKNEIDLSDWLNSDRFYKNELSSREKLLYPPFAEFIRISFCGKDKEKVAQESALSYKKLTKRLSESFESEDFRIIPPLPAIATLRHQQTGLPAIVSKIKNKYGADIFLRIKKSADQFLPTNEYIEKRNNILEILPKDVVVKINPQNSLR